MMSIEERAIYLTHVLYEIEEYLNRRYIKVTDDNQRHMSTELNMLHTRVLYYFLYDKKPKPDDIAGIRDYRYTPTGEFNLEDIKPIHKHLAHLTINRQWGNKWWFDVKSKLDEQVIPDVEGFLKLITDDKELMEFIRFNSLFRDVFKLEERIDNLKDILSRYLRVVIL